MNLETTIPLYMLLAGLLTFIIAIFNKENHNYEKDKNTDVKKFYDKHCCSNATQYIPGYVHYLRRREEY